MTMTGIFTGMVGSDVELAEMDPSSVPVDLSPLFPAEAAMMTKAVDKRRREFTAGRVLARQVLARLDRKDVVLVNGDDRAPIWPEGIVGSITHTAGWCAVVVAPTSRRRALGLDIESDEPLKPAILEAITAPEDRAWLAERPEAERLRLGKVIFSAKECAYKAQYALTREFLGFEAMWVAVDERAGRWRATFRQKSGEHFAAGDVIEGRFTQRNGLVATAVELHP